METYSNARNPVLPLGCHVPDGEARVMPDGRLYVYGSLDREPGVYCSDEYRVVSTADLRTWTVHDRSFRVADVPWHRDRSARHYPGGVDWSRPTPFLKRMLEEHPIDPSKIEWRGDLLYAPDAIECDGRYYLFFCMSDQSEGVAVSDRPEGPFGQAVRLPCDGIDPAVLIDDDGSPFYYWGQFSANGVRLDRDLLGFDRDRIETGLLTEEAHFFHEGFSIRKHAGTYYAVYSAVTRGKPTSLAYATSDSPLGPFTYRGILIDNDGCDPDTWNDHGSIECFHGQWYVFYHRSSRGSQYFRRLCIEPIAFDVDGSIAEVRMTSQGAGAPFAPGERIASFHACGLTGHARLMPRGESESLVGIEDGDTATFRYVKNDAPLTSLTIQGTGSCRVRVLAGGRSVARFAVEGATSEELAVPPGLHEVVLLFEDPDDYEFEGMTFA
jgi:arabinoxylan arabinofuranohydrolase